MPTSLDSLVVPLWCHAVPGASILPLRDVDGLPVVYALGRSRETFHVGQTTQVSERARRYASQWRDDGLAMPTWVLYWPVPLRTLHRTEAAMQTWLLPSRDDPKTIHLRAHHVHWLERLGLERREIRLRYRTAWTAYWRRRVEAGTWDQAPPPCRMPR